MYLSVITVLLDFLSYSNLSSPVLSIISATTYLVMSNYSYNFKFISTNDILLPEKSGFFLAYFKISLMD